ncbi:hypothetical protein [Pedobacter gandavensis]|uniref:hypothetical protein n=1 Tax=Pedobacter gandavensis TaxID=2679963 RepID=UPI00292DCE54|nr:hypothetical protein [Pedobacter gandavensis]
MKLALMYYSNTPMRFYSFSKLLLLLLLFAGAYQPEGQLISSSGMKTYGRNIVDPY